MATNVRRAGRLAILGAMLLCGLGATLALAQTGGDAGSAEDRTAAHDGGNARGPGEDRGRPHDLG